MGDVQIMLKIIETTVINKLKEQFPEFEIDSFPVDFSLYTFTSPLGCILLRYDKSKISNQNALCAVMADESYNFVVFTGLRYAQTHSDVYPFLKKLKTVLNGLNILNKKLLVNEISFEDEINGDLWYSYDIQITLPLTDEYPDISAASELLGCFNNINKWEKNEAELLDKQTTPPDVKGQ